MTGAGAIAALAQQRPVEKKPDDSFVAGATQDPTPRVGIVLSSFKAGEDHDGTKIPGLRDPQPPGADLTPAQLDAMVRKAIDVAARRTAEFWETDRARRLDCHQDAAPHRPADRGRRDLLSGRTQTRAPLHGDRPFAEGRRMGAGLSEAGERPGREVPRGPL